MRIRLPRQRLNPVPGTKSTQSRYFLGYFVFVDDPDVGYAVAIRSAGPQGRLRQEMGLPPDVLKQQALLKAQDAAQKLSDKTDRKVAFMPILPQATKYEAVEHLYGGAGSRRYGGPNARASVTLSRTRLPNRAVNQTALASVQAHWESLYGEGQVGQTGWPRTSPAFRTPEAFSAGAGSLRFRPESERQREASRMSARVRPVSVEELKAQIQKMEQRQSSFSALFERLTTPPGERESARARWDEAEAKIAALRAQLAAMLGEPEGLFNMREVLEQADVSDTTVTRSWVNAIVDEMDPEQVLTDSVGTAANFFISTVEKAYSAGRVPNARAIAKMLRREPEFQQYRDEFIGLGIDPESFEALITQTILMLVSEGEMQSA